MIIKFQKKKMGIKSLSKFLKDKYPDIFELIHISEYAFKKIAIDVSLYLCNYKAVYGEGWLKAFIKLVAFLRENDIHCTFIYDTKSPPEKEAEKKDRYEKKSKQEDRMFELEDAIDNYNQTGRVSEYLLEFQKKRGIKPIKSMVSSSVNIRALESALEKMKQQLFTITPDDFENTRKVFTLLNVPYFNAPMEAETMCADLCIQGKVDAVLTEDTDVLAYGAPTFLTKLNINNGTCLRINYEKLLSALELTSDSFLDFCIMCGTDYNKNIPRVGPAKAFTLISHYENIDSIANTGMDVKILNHVRVRELFRDYEKSDVKVSYCGIPNFEKLEEYLMTKNIYINLDSLKRCFTANNLEIVEDDINEVEDDVNGVEEIIITEEE